MFCSNCGKQIADGSKFCSFCGATVEVPTAPAYEAPVASSAAEFEPKEEPRKPVFETIDWNVNEYPSTDTSAKKTEDIDFDWGADPKDIKDRYTKGLSSMEKAEVKVKSEMAETADGVNVDKFIAAKPEPAEPAKDLSAADKIDKFYTFSKKNEDFQRLLNKEYEKIRGGNPIQQEQSVADRTADEKFTKRPEDPSMDAFLKREGIEKPYQPKAFESEVLQKIEAQERAKEEARLEEEARQQALEEARIKAEQEARRAAEEAERIRMEEEIRMRAVEEARAKAAEEARLAEEEARRAEEEARIAAQREARIKAEEEARARAEEERARLKAEADLRAQQEAAKIKAQHEARIAIEEEERYKADLERRHQEEERLRERLTQTQQNLRNQADSAAAAEEARKVLNQTARMKEEEAAKIRAAVAGLKGEAEPVFAKPVEPIQAADPILEAVPVEPVPVKAVPVEAVPAEPVPAEPVLTDANVKAHQATKDTLSEMARARQEFLAEFGNEGEKPVTGRNTMRSESTDMSATRTVDKNAVLSGLEATMRISKEELRATPAIDAREFEAPSIRPRDNAAATVEDLLNQFVSDEEEPEAAVKPVKEVETAETVGAVGSAEVAEAVGTAEEPIAEGFAVKEEPTIAPSDTAGDEVKPGLDNTMVMTEGGLADGGFEDGVTGSFDEYGEKEAEELKRRQEVGADALAADFAPAEQASAEKSTSRISDENSEEGKEKSGAGRIILKVLLIILIVIFAAELAGIGIKFLAPNSKAADVIDNQLNKVIHLITGSEQNYNVPGIEYKA